MLQASSLALIGMLTVVGCGGSDNPPTTKRDGGPIGGDGGPTVGSVKVDKAVLDFGAVDVGATSTAQTVNVTVSVAPVAINATVTGSGFAIAATTCTPIQAIGACTISVKFAPASIGAATGVLTVGTTSVALSGTGQTAGTFSVTDRVDLGTLLVGATASAVVQVVPSPSVTGLTCVASGANLVLASQTCAATGAIAAPCSFTFTFKAATAGVKSDAVVCSAGGTVKQATVAATVVTPSQLSINPPTAQLGASVGATDTQTFVVSNNGGSPTGNLTATISAGATDFAITSNDCVVPLASLGVCRITVTFKPTTAGAKTGSLTVADATAGSTPAKADLTGTAVAASAVAITPNPSDFGSVTVGSPKATSFTVKNSGGTATDAIKISTGGTEFVVDAALCNGLPLAPAAQCVFTVTFAPTSAGAKSATIIAEAAGIAVATAKVTGTAVAQPTGPVLAITPPTLDFGTTGVGVPVGPLVLTVKNAGDTATGVLSVVKKDSPSSVGGASQFSFTTTCSAALAAGETCQVAVTYTPTIAGSASGILTVSDGAVSTANGTVIGIALSIPTLSVTCAGTFANTIVGKTSAPVVCTVSNDTVAGGQTPQESGAITPTVSGDFVLSANNCTASLAPNTSCTLSVAFKPTAKGERTGALTIASANKGAANKPLTATGLLTVEIVEVFSGSVVADGHDFGQVSTGAASTTNLTLAVYVRGSVGNLAITGTDIQRLSDSAKANFTQVAGGAAPYLGHDCSSLATYAANETTPACYVILSFTPQSKGAKTTTITATGADGSTDKATAQGTGTGPLTISPTALTFDAVAIGSSSARALTLTVCNSAPTTGTGSTVAVTGANAAEFAIVADNVSNQTLLSGAGNCRTIELRLDIPATDTAGPRSAKVTVTTTIAGVSESASADLVGSAGNPGILTATASGPFADTAVTATSAPVIITVTNTGSLPTNALAFDIPVTNVDFTMTAPDGQAQGTCIPNTTKLNPNESCTRKVWFKPTAGPGISKRLGTLTVSSTVGGVVTLQLSANATSQLKISPDTVQDTGLQAVTLAGVPDPAAPVKTFTITNLGGADIAAGNLEFKFVLPVSGVEDLPGHFRVKRNGCLGILGKAGSTSPADTCTVDVQLNTAELGPHSAIMQVTATDNDTQRVTVPVTGTAAQVANLAFTTASQANRDFGTVLLGQTSLTQTFTVVNRGGFPASALTFGFVSHLDHTTPHAKKADFKTTGSTCVGDGAVLQPGATCDIVVAFSPTQCQAGDTVCGVTTQSVNVELLVTAANGTPTTGIATRPTLTGTTTVDTVAVYMVENTSLKAPYDFGLVPAAEGPKTVKLAIYNVTTSAFTLPANAAAVAVAAAPNAGAGVGTWLATEFVASADTGAAAPCAFGGSLAAGAHCTFVVTWTPSTWVGTREVAISAGTDGAGNNVGMTLIGRVPAPAAFEVLPSPLNFGDVAEGTDSATMSVTIRNSGDVATDGDLQIVPQAVTHASEVSVVSGCSGAGSALAGGKSCVLSLKVHPGTSGAVGSFAPLRVRTLGATTPISAPINVQWNGIVGATISPTDTTLVFPRTPVLTTSATRTVTLDNNGGVITGPLSISVDSDNFAVDPASTCLAPGLAFTGIAAGGDCTVILVFRPTTLAAAAKTGNLKVTSTSGASTTVALTGTAIAALVVQSAAAGGNGTFTAATSTAAASLAYKATSITGTELVDVAFTIRNTGGVATGLLSTSIGGASTATPDQFKIVADTCVGVSLGSVAATYECTVTVRFAPTSVGLNKNAVLTVVDPSSGTPADSVTVALTGNANP